MTDTTTDGGRHPGKKNDYEQAWLNMVKERDSLRAEVERLRAAITDIDAHATPMGEDEQGFVTGGYRITVGAMHRALAANGGRTGVPCDCDSLRASLYAAKLLLWDYAKAAMTVKPLLDAPYADDPRWTPWTRWVEKVQQRVGAFLDALSTETDSPSSP